MEQKIDEKLVQNHVQKLMYIAGVLDSGCTIWIHKTVHHGQVVYQPVCELIRDRWVLERMREVVGGYIGRKGKGWRLRLKCDHLYDALDMVGMYMTTKKTEIGVIVKLRGCIEAEDKEKLRDALKKKPVLSGSSRLPKKLPHPVEMRLPGVFRNLKFSSDIVVGVPDHHHP